jgi:4-amino-4-deoxy-L-arabinose transferase-like glycosyltransferase
VNKINKKRVILISFVIFLLIVFTNLLNFLFLDKTPPHWDYALHLKNSFLYLQYFKNLNLIKIITTYVYYPPLTYILFSFFIIIMDYSKFTVLIFNFSFLVLTLYVVYRFTKRLFDKTTSLILVAFLIFLVVTLSPAGVLIWELMPDFPLMALIFILYCIFYLSLKENNFSLKKSLFLGLIIALAFLIKWSAIIYLFIPVLFYLISSFKKGYFKESLLIFYPTLFLSGLWYFPHIKLIFRDLIKYGIYQAYLE